jgi:4-amino-4-deoxy-L-arabinose transferase-like glycosyltransferase
MLAAALGCGAMAYRDHFLEDVFWWRWVGELLAGCILLTVGLGSAPLPPERPVRRWARRVAGVITVVAVVVAMRLQPQRGQEMATAVVIGVGLTAFFISRWLPFAAEDLQALIGDPAAAGPQHPARTGTSITAIVTSVAAAVTAAVVNTDHHLVAFLLWLLSLVLFVAAFWQQRAPETQDAGTRRWSNDGGPTLSPRVATALLALILVLALSLRVTLLHDVPRNVDPDEGRQGRYAESIWKDGFPDAFDIGWNVFPNLSYMVEYVWVQALGTSNPHLRLSAATVGTLSLVPVFFWVRRWWGNVIALMAVSLLAINREHIFWSRLALNNIQQVLVAGLVLAAFARVLRTRRWLDWVWFGYAIGLAFHTYHAAKLFPVLLASAAALFAIGIRGFTRQYIAGSLVGAIAFVLCLGPLTVAMHQKWEQFYGGTSNRFDVARLKELSQQGDIREMRSFIWSHVGGCLLSFTSTPQPREAIFDAFVAVPFLVGVGWILWGWRDPRHVVVLVWTAGILVIGGILTGYPPWKARLIGFLPTICVIPAIVAGRLRHALFRWSPAHADLVAVPLLFLWLGAALQRNWNTEFIVRPQVQQGTDFQTEIYRIIDSTPLPATFYMLRGAEIVELKLAINDCMVAADPNRLLVDPPDDPTVVPIPPKNRGTAVLIVARYQEELVPLIRHYYPDAHYQVVVDPNDGGPILHVFTLTADEIERTRGLRATYQTETRTWSADAGTAAFILPPERAELPVSVTWRGQVRIPEPAAYAFRSVGGTLHIDERPIAGESIRVLAAGWHPIELNATFSQGQESVTLEWKPPGVTEWTTIPKVSLQTHPEGHGLLGRYFAGVLATTAPEPVSASPDYTRIDTALSFDWVPEQDDNPPAPFAARPSTMEWIGTVELPEGTPQKIRLEVTTPTQVFIDGKLVLAAQGKREGERVEAEISGLNGRVPILVRTVRPATNGVRFWKSRLLWRQPGGGWTAFANYHPPDREAVSDQLSAISSR